MKKKKIVRSKDGIISIPNFNNNTMKTVPFKIKMILFSGLGYIFGIITMFFVLINKINNGDDLYKIPFVYYVFIVISAIALFFWIYCIILWRKYDRELGSIIALIFLNGFYMPFYFIRIIKRIRENN